MKRYDYAVFDGEEFVTNALLSVKQAASMEARGYRCVRVSDRPWENLPRFRGRSYVRSERPFSRRWGGR